VFGSGARRRQVVAVVSAVLAAAIPAFVTGGARARSRSSSVPVTIHVNRQSLVLGSGVLTVTGQVGDTGQQGISVSVESSSDGGPWQYQGGSTFLARSGSVSVEPLIDRNTLFRVHVAALNDPSFNAYSAAVLVYVRPSVSLSVAALSATVLEVSYQALVHPVSHAPRRRIFVYTRHRGQHLFHLVASRWLRYSAQTEPQYDLRYRLHNRGAVTVLVCIRRPLLPDMGKPFHDPACGRRSGLP
jgi:hypothetical protein